MWPGVLFLVWFNIILPGLWASIGVSLSYSSRPFLCALECSILILLDMPCSRNLNQATRHLLLGGGWGLDGLVYIRLFTALIRNTRSLVPRFLPMGKILHCKNIWVTSTIFWSPQLHIYLLCKWNIIAMNFNNLTQSVVETPLCYIRIILQKAYKIIAFLVTFGVSLYAFVRMAAWLWWNVAKKARLSDSASISGKVWCFFVHICTHGCMVTVHCKNTWVTSTIFLGCLSCINVTKKCY